MDKIPNVQWIIDKCMEAINQIEWIENVQYDDNVTVSVATNLARRGFDGGKDAILQLQPAENDFGGWMAYAELCTVLYNRGRTTKKYTILRNCYANKYTNIHTLSNRELTLNSRQ